jgi:CubicO group peptidase (beta-lactamase class C family)
MLSMDLHTAARIADDVFGDTPETASVPGVAFGLVHQGELVHVGGLGHATIGGPAPGPDTVFRIASMTKSFTAATILMLRDEGRLRLDDELAAHLPVAASIGAMDRPAITLRDLLTMGSGLATDDPWGDRLESLSTSDFDALVAGGLTFCRPPRTAFEYSNTGYALLGRVIEEVSGTSYQHFVRERICLPLGMPSTDFYQREVSAERLATGYRLRSDGAPVAEPSVSPGAYSAMGGLLSTVEDLGIWVAEFAGAWTGARPGHPVDRWSLREAQEMARFAALSVTMGPGAGAVASGYGFGLMVEEHEVLGRIVWHSGGYPGFGSHMRWHPRSGWGVIALGNSTYAPMHIPAAAALARLVVEGGGAHGAMSAISAIPPAAWPQTLAAVDLAEQLLRGLDVAITDEVWSPNMDLDIPRDERMASLADIRDAIGRPRRVDDTLEHLTPGRSRWIVKGDSGSAQLEVWMTPERVPRIQKLMVSRLTD